MNPKAFAEYQMSQQKGVQQALRSKLDVIMKRGTLYNLVFLQNAALLENFLSVPQSVISKEQMKQVEKILLWLEQTQEGAKIS